MSSNRTRANERRDGRRVRHAPLECDAGLLLDLSPRGARLLSNKRRRDHVNVTIADTEGRSLKQRARIAWHKRLGFRKHIHGLAFEDCSPNTMQAMADLIEWSRTNPNALAQKLRRQAVRRAAPMLAFLGLLLFAFPLLADLNHFAAYMSQRWSFDPDGVVQATRHIATFTGIGLLMTGICMFVAVVTRGDAGLDSQRKSMRINGRIAHPQQVLNAVIDSSISGIFVLRAVRNDEGEVAELHCELMNETAENIVGVSRFDAQGTLVGNSFKLFKEMGIVQMAGKVVRFGLPVEKECFSESAQRWFAMVANRCGDGLILTVTDISHQKQTEEKLRHDAFHDALTRLPNRKALEQRLEEALDHVHKNSGEKFAVLFLDFDRFKIINDSLGHEVGDALLINIADKLRENLRSSDTRSHNARNLPSRLGGDEFVVLLDSVESAREAEALAERLLAEFSKPHDLGEHEVVSTASIGIVVADDRYQGSGDVLRDADTAMYRAKSAGKAQYVVFDESMHADMVRRLELEKELRIALENHSFVLEYEPIVDLQTSEIAGFEALARWPHPVQGRIPPSVFVDLAEELGLITDLGEWVLNEACATLKKLEVAHMGDQPLFMNVNLSRRQLLDPNLFAVIHRAIQTHDVDPAQLCLEITENTVAGGEKQMPAVLGHIKSLGVSLAIDDFGTGHSSLESLHRMPLDVLKIDRSFTAAQNKTAKSWASILHATADLAHNLSMAVIAEGIETPDQLALLQGLDCEFGQGWLFSKSIDAETALDMVRHGLPMTRMMRPAA